MSSLRSSVRPRSSKQPWGTVLQPEFGLGFQRMTQYEIKQSTNRLYFVPDKPQAYYPRPQQRQLDRIGIKEMLKRLTKDSNCTTPDTRRTVRGSRVEPMGVVSSYAWRGYN